MSGEPPVKEFFERIQAFVGWTAEDARWMPRAWESVRSAVPAAVEDFYENIRRFPFSASVINGGPQQVERLKRTLTAWIESLFSGVYDLDFAESRWRVGRRHVEIGLPQSYAIGALARLRVAFNRAMLDSPRSGNACPHECLLAVNKLLDIDSAIIELAYNEYFAKSLREAAAEKLRQTERLASIGQMVTGLAHESRNALQRSGACLEALLLEIEHQPEALKQALRIQAALDHLHVLYEEVRNYAAPIRLDLEPVALVSRVNQAWQMLRARWSERNISFSVRTIGSTEPEILADSHRLDQVFANLLQNAIQAVGSEGSIECQIEVQQAWVRVSIADSGPGIPDESLAQIFDPFFTTKPRGTGLGLTITRRIVLAHGGQITVGTGRLSGACFTLVFPVSGHRPSVEAFDSASQISS